MGAQLGPIAYAVVSESPRTLKTVIAMGVAVDDIVPLGAGYSYVNEWGAPFSHLDGVRLAFDAESFDLVEFHRYGTGAAA